MLHVGATQPTLFSWYDTMLMTFICLFINYNMHRCASSKENIDTFNTLGFHSIAVQHHADVAGSIVKSSYVLASSGTKPVTDRDIGNSQLSGALLSAIREQIMSKPFLPHYLFTMQ